MGPLIANDSPGFRLWICTDARPFEYFLMRKVSSPGAFEGEMGVYGRITGFPCSFFNASGSDDLTTTQDATGRSEAWFSGNSKMNLKRNQNLNISRLRQCSLRSIVVVRLNLLQPEIFERVRVKRALLLHRLLQSSDLVAALKVRIGTQSSSTCTRKVKAPV